MYEAITEILEIHSYFDKLRFKNNQNIHDAILYIAEMEGVHCQAFPSHLDWEKLFADANAKIDLLLYEAECNITIAILLKIKEQV